MGDDQNKPSSSRHSHSAPMDELRRRLSRIGVTTAWDFVPKPPVRRRSLDELVQGVIHDTVEGPSFRVVRTYDPASRHGSYHLADWLRLDSTTLERVGGEPRLRQADIRRYVFLDTETTGLGAGTGVFAFLVGIGYFNDEGAFEVHQFFLRDPAEERAMLVLLHDMLWPDGALVTFNGRSFDVPLLADRFVLSRMPSRIMGMPNLDLLHPARRLWKRRLPSCRLSALEVDVLGLQRDGADVPGSLIPYLYRQYLQSGDGYEMTRVLYHNEQDILSMVSLAIALCHVFERPSAPAVPIDDHLSLARWYEQRGMVAECESAYRAILDSDADGEMRAVTLFGLAALLKRCGRAGEAIVLWEYLADLKLDIVGYEELAKYYEWQAGDLSRALTWTEAGLQLARTWRLGLRRTEAERALGHRRERLLNKMTRQAERRL